MVLEAKRSPTDFAKVFPLCLFLLKVLFHMQTVLIHVKKRFTTDRTNFENVFDVHELVQFLLDPAGRQIFSANLTLESVIIIIGGRRGVCGNGVAKGCGG